jgi:hypothetical protein
MPIYEVVDNKEIILRAHAWDYFILRKYRLEGVLLITVQRLALLRDCIASSSSSSSSGTCSF